MSILKAAQEVIKSADKFNSEYPNAATTADELFMPGLTEYNKAFENLRKEVSKAEKKKQ